MPANTTRGYPYPLPTEPVAEGAQAIRNLAEAVDTKEGMVRLADVTLAAAGTFDLQNIPQTYSALRLLALLRGAAGTALEIASMRFNNDSGTVYHYQLMRAQAASVAGTESLAQTTGRIANIPGNTAAAAFFAPVTIDMPHYVGAGSNVRPYISTWAWLAANTASNVDTGQIGGFYQSGNAINRIQILAASGNLAVGSRVLLYGLR